MSFLKGLNNLLFPKDNICFFCNEKEPKIVGYICTDCMKNLEYLNREVKLIDSYLDKVIYSLFYNRFIKEQIYAYKYYSKNYLYKPLGEILLDTIKEKSLVSEIDIITYVPLHRRRKALRGYDQSELIGRYISKKLKIPFAKGNLIRKKSTKSQTKLNKNQRIKNLENAFYVKDSKEFLNKKVLLIDDIITTGSTMEECGRVLIEKGAGKVIGLAITSGMKA